MPILTGEPDEMDRLVEIHKPDLVLLNLVLPGTDGFELMKRIPDVAKVPVIVLSGRGTGQDIARAFEIGAADYVVKPFSPTELVARIRAALRKRAMYEQTRVLAPLPGRKPDYRLYGTQRLSGRQPGTAHADRVQAAVRAFHQCRKCIDSRSAAGTSLE